MLSALKVLNSSLLDTEPSITYNGVFCALIERFPRMVMVGADPGLPDERVTLTPATRPRSISPTFPAGKLFISSVLTEATEVAI